MTYTDQVDHAVLHALRKHPVNVDDGLTAEEIRHRCQMVLESGGVQRSIGRLRRIGFRIETTVRGRQPGRYKMLPQAPGSGGNV